MVLLKPLPGQEERNARYLITRGAALRARNAAELVRSVETLLDDPRVAAGVRANAAALAHPDAADRIAERIERLARPLVPA
jgi:processive 1,2-diacylglycerol beta-glucosyltransferase